MRLDLRELVLHVIRIHGLDLLTSGCAEDLDDLHKLIDTTLAGEEGLAKHQLGHDTSSRPDIDICRVVGRPKDKLWRAIVA